MPETVLVNPYIGPTAFTESDRYRFFGRKDETRELTSLVIARRAVLLYAQSGSGKTSLLQASLIPELRRRKRVETFPIARVMGSVEESANLYVENALGNLFPDAAAGSFAGKTFSQSLAALLNADARGRRHPRLVILDQFEEIFTFHPELKEQRKAFFEQLGDCLAAYPQLSLLLSMREDYLADLEAYTALLPDRMRARMRLERLGVSNAVEAIREPAAEAGMPFATGVAESLADNLRRIRTGSAGTKEFALGDYIEPVQLQIVCRQLWSRLTEDGERQKPEIDADDIANYANVDDALIQFYRDALAKAEETGVTERALRRWFGERLITPADTRGLVYRGRHDTEGLPNAVVDILADCYIIRADLRGGSTWYELAHDRLVDPVQEDNQAWKLSYRNPIAEAMEKGPDNLLTGKALAEGRQYAQEHPEELTPEEGLFLKRSVEEERAARARRRTRNVSVALAMLVLVALAGFAFWEALLADRTALEEATAVAKAKSALAAESAARLVALDEEIHAEANAVEADKQRREAVQHAEAERRERVIAEQERKSADLARGEAVSERLVKKAKDQTFSEFDLAALLALEAKRAADTFDARDALYTLMSANPGLISIMKQSARVAAIAISPDGKVLAALNTDGDVRLWDVDTHQPHGKALHAGPGQPASVAFSHDGKLLAVAAPSGVSVWDMTSEPSPLEPPNYQGVRGVAFSPDGKLLALACQDTKVRLWDVKTHAVEEVPGHSGVVATVVFSPDGGLVASSAYDGSVRLWDVNNHKLYVELKVDPSKSLSSVAFSPDGKTLALGNFKGLRIWEVSPNPSLDAPSLAYGWVGSVAFSPDGNVLELASGQMIHFLDFAHRKANAMMGQRAFMLLSQVVNIAFSPKGDTLFSAGFDQTVRQWTVAPPQLRPSTSLPGHTGTVIDVAFSSDGTLIASASLDKTIRLWDVGTHRTSEVPLGGQGSAVNKIAFSPDSKSVVSANADGTVKVWDMAQNPPKGDLLTRYKDNPTGVAFSSDGRLVATASRSEVRLWDPATRTAVGEPLQGGSPVEFSHDGTLLASAGPGNTVLLWDVTARPPTLRSTSEGNPNAITSLAFSADDGTLAIGTLQIVRLWDVRLGQALKPLTGLAGSASSMAFSPGGKIFAAAFDNPMLRLWDVATWQPLGPSLGAQLAGRCVAFSPNGKLLAVGKGDGTVVIWNIDLDSWGETLCSIANRNLSLDEWQQFIGPEVRYHRTCPNLPSGNGVAEK